jgi:hypothetical protein
MNAATGTRAAPFVEVRAFTYHQQFGLRRHCGHLEYRTLAGAGRAPASFWLEYRKATWGAPMPLCRARTRQRLVEKLYAEAGTLGQVVQFAEVRGTQ